MLIYGNFRPPGGGGDIFQGGEDFVVHLGYGASLNVEPCITSLSIPLETWKKL